MFPQFFALRYPIPNLLIIVSAFMLMLKDDSLPFLIKILYSVYQRYFLLKERSQICRNVPDGLFMSVVFSVNQISVIGDAGGELLTKFIHRCVCLIR